MVVEKEQQQHRGAGQDRTVAVDHFLGGLQAAAVVTVLQYHKRNHYELFQRLRDSGRHPYLKYIFLVGDVLPAGALSISKMMQTPIEDRYPADFL